MHRYWFTDRQEDKRGKALLLSEAMQNLHNVSDENERRSCGVGPSIFEEEGTLNSSLFRQDARRKEEAGGLGRIPNPLQKQATREVEQLHKTI